ncbi:uncharacterized protein LOC131537548 [Onychostoma macrolepis]|uniref:Uncharacterized protein n=1 Tax=Onychostoma macrolepis TaxID=369639 RepID=A0A7J6D7W8_9TELE|nr:uncharacterized protein LOC131537548 [Onychostoma macrolepis]KAF4115261.1 hypothetical protein G5714_002750 [Onychostoma macrolepis]
MFVPALLTCIVLRAFSAQAKVAENFDCKEFFYRDTEPGGMDQNAKKICQFTAKFGPHYATLYSVYHRIPLYSAYRFDPTCFTDSGRPSFWHLEPQISEPEEQNLHAMVRETQHNKNDYKGNQAISDDYSETGYDRGHLNPNSFQCGEGRIATFTLTNAAPMDACFNRNQWAKWEKTLRTFLRDKLSSDGGSATVYIITGTVPPDENLRIPQSEISEEPERVTVPSHIWTAVCYKHHSDDRKSFSFGYMGENTPEGSINLMSVLNLNTQIQNLYRQLSSIFVDDCFHDNNKLDGVKVKFQKLINLQSKEKQGVQMSSGMQSTYLALRKAADSNIIPEKKFKVSEMTIKLAFDSMSTYNNVVKDMKLSAESTCLITLVKPQVRGKRDISGVSDAVECLLVPEKQKTAADGSPCSKFSDSTYSCECETNGEIKSCCSTPCLYRDNLNSYRCYSGQTQIECSARYSLITFKGEKCLDDHPCATYGNDYYWCNTISGSWDYCSPPLWRSIAKNGKYCRSDHACAKYGSGQMWCYTDDEGNYEDCCTSDDCHLAVNGQTCRSDHKCGYHGNDYLWCYTDYEDNWDYCCRSC